MTKNKKTILVITQIVILFFIGCDKLSDRVSQDSSLLPPNAVNVEYLNDNWGKFEYEGETYLFQQTMSPDSRCYIHLPKDNKPSANKFRCPQCGAKVVITDLGPVQVVD